MSRETMGKNVPLIPLSSRRGWKPSERTISDIPPTVWNNVERQQEHSYYDGTSSSVENHRSCCAVCQERESRYTCPRCQVRYCSMECYRNHSSSSSSSSSSSCTEDFYRDKVNVHMKLESLGQRDKTMTLLNRYHANVGCPHPRHGSLSAGEDRTDIDNGNDDDEEEEEEGSDLSILLEEEALYEVLSKLERSEKDDVDSIPSQILNNLLPPSLKFMFEKDLRDGKVQELLLERWHPWWRKELVLSKEDVHEEDSDGTIGNKTTTQLSRCDNTLDGRILLVPNFGRLHKGGASISKTLLFNLVEILYATCWTLRLYHGIANASKNEPVEAATTLVAASTVLGRDARFVDLSQVLTHCTASSTGCYGHQRNHQLGVGCNSHWTVLVEDVALLVATHRTVGRTLLEASDMIKGACKQLRTTVRPVEKGKCTDGDDSTMLTNFRQIRKKIEFFLSWSQYTPTTDLFGDNLKGEILTWKDEWMALGMEQDDEDQVITQETVMRSLDLQFPSTTSSPSKQAQKDLTQPPCDISEVQSRRLQ